MGRKIPGRKHRGIRDPEKQAAVRYDIIKDKINAPPSNPDDQAIPKSLHKLVEQKNKVKSGVFNIRPKNRKKKGQISNENDILSSKNEQLVGKPEKPIPVFKQLHGESDRQFVKRMNNICMSVTKEAEFEQKFGVHIRRNEEGEIEGVFKRPKDELELMLMTMRKEKKEKKDKKKKKKAESNTIAPRLSKSQKRQKKLREKKLKREQQNVDEFKKYKDDVKFGETVHAPPSLTAPRRAEKLHSAPRPGKKNLLLNSFMQTEGGGERTPLFARPKEEIRRTTNKIIDKKGKRKDLPNALRRQLDKQQKEIISAYKEIKSKMYKT